MTDRRTVVVIGGTSGIGREIARRAVARGDEVVLSGRDPRRAAAVAGDLGSDARGIAVDLAEPDGLATQLAGIGAVDHLVLSAIERDQNTVGGYDLTTARSLVTLKLVGYTEVVHALSPRMAPGAAVVIFGGLAKDRPYPGSTTVSTVNGGIIGLVHTLAVELAPIRVNAIHPGIVGDSPFWSGRPLDHILARTPAGRLTSMEDVAGATEFLLHNRAVNGVNLAVDGGWLLT